MANRGFHPLEHPAVNRKVVWGHFHPAGTGAPTGLVGKGVASVARADVGVFTLTLSDKYQALEAWDIKLMLNAAGSEVGELAAEAVASAGTVSIRIVNKATAAAADVAAHANNAISFILCLKNTNVD